MRGFAARRKIISGSAFRTSTANLCAPIGFSGHADAAVGAEVPATKENGDLDHGRQRTGCSWPSLGGHNLGMLHEEVYLLDFLIKIHSPRGICISHG